LKINLIQLDLLGNSLFNIDLFRICTSHIQLAAVSGRGPTKLISPFSTYPTFSLDLDRSKG
ncbi:MAG: hypothetical protein PHH55_09545, partial [Candidatus Delongbacteria bacterium]|nr:hypothetical protein [Candidatus Delongbacteria bacterium]